MEAPAPTRSRADLARRALLTCVASLLASCASTPTSEDVVAEPIFPSDLSGWKEGRACGFTHEHELRYIRVLVDAAAETPYKELSADHPYPVGATLVKLEYDDEACTKLLGYTAMRKEPAGYSAAGHDWRWQRVGVDRQVTEDGELKSCIHCHEHHCTEPQCGYAGCGYDLTCAQEE